MALTLSENTTARIAEAAAQRGMDAEEMLLEFLDFQEAAAQAERRDLIAAVEEGLADVEAGRTRPFADFVAEERAFWAARRASQGAE